MFFTPVSNLLSLVYSILKSAEDQKLTNFSSTYKTQTHPFHGPFSRITWVSQYQKGKTNLDFTEARDSEWQQHQLGYMQVCTSLQTDNHTSTPPLSFYRPDALPAAQPTASKHWRSKHWRSNAYKTHAHIIILSQVYVMQSKNCMVPLLWK